MNKLNISRYKKSILAIITAVIMLILASIIGVKVSAKIDKDDKYNYIMDLIKQEKYIYALGELEDIQDFSAYSKEEIEKINNYKKMLTKYIEIDEEAYVRDLIKALEEFLNNYRETLNEDIFEKLKESLGLKIDNCKEKIKLLDEEKSKIIEVIEMDIVEGETLLKIFKSENPKEDVSEIEAIIENRKEEIALNEENAGNTNKVEAEKATTEENTDVSENEAITETNNDNEPKISNTIAAQSSNQLITVVSNGGSYAELTMWEKLSNGKWIEVDSMPARLGENGMKYYGDVYEMDKCTPTGIYTLSEAFGINENPGSALPYRVLDGSEYWVDDENSDYYNTMQFGDANGRWNSAEHLSSFQGYYNYSIVIDYNRWTVISGKSSAIFLHCDLGSYTYGCVAIAEDKLINILKWLKPNNNPKIILDFTYDNIYNNY